MVKGWIYIPEMGMDVVSMMMLSASKIYVMGNVMVGVDVMVAVDVMANGMWSCDLSK